MVEPRITIHVNEEGGPSGVVEMFLNDEGREILLRELLALSKENDHFHFFAPQWGWPGGPLKLTPYSAEESTAGHLKVLYRPDEWDREFYPEVFAAHLEEKCEDADD